MLHTHAPERPGKESDNTVQRLNIFTSADPHTFCILFSQFLEFSIFSIPLFN